MELRGEDRSRPWTLPVRRTPQLALLALVVVVLASLIGLALMALVR